MREYKLLNFRLLGEAASVACAAMHLVIRLIRERGIVYEDVRALRKLFQCLAWFRSGREHSRGGGAQSGCD